MKPHTLPVKRRPAPKGILKRLSAVTGNRKQRVAATATPDMEIEDSSSKISRALTIIFLIHIVAIALIFVHQKFLDGRAPEQAEAAPAAAAGTQAPAAAAVPPEILPKMGPSDQPYIVRAGDNYTRIAAMLQVDEGDLRLINEHMEIAPGRFLKVPAKRIQPEPVATTLEQPAAATEVMDGLVDNVDVRDAPRAQLVRPNTRPAAAQPAAPAASGKSYVVQNGDSVWRIANRFKVSQDALMKANGIADAKKMKVGMNLVIP
ncbi:MAG: LysM peptidoglycan-binding domain-containing protein [Verrucomicrobiaceae bacterium]|nr:MAG: LysM peptidoglycan-binding domain-containing protein [Verrucomicrobiaceae bacterium]